MLIISNLQQKINRFSVEKSTLKQVFMEKLDFMENL